MNVNLIKPVRRKLRKGYSLEFSIMMVLSQQAMKSIDNKFKSLDRKLDILLSGHHLLAADRMVKAQEADEKKGNNGK